MARPQIEYGRKSPRSPRTRVYLIVLLLLLLFGAHSAASYAIDREVWKERGQLATWCAMLTYSFAPLLAGTLVAFVVFWVAHARALKLARTALSEHPLYSRLSA